MDALEKRLRRLRQQLAKRGLVKETNNAGLPWTMTVAEATRRLGIKSEEIERQIRLGHLLPRHYAGRQLPASQFARLFR